MANALFDYGRNHFLLGDVNWVGHRIDCFLVDDNTYTNKNLTTNEFLTSLNAGSRVASTTLAGKTAVAGVADANDITFTAVSGAVSEELVLVRFVTGDADSYLLVFIDQATGLPVTPNTGDIVVRWSDTTNKIFKL